MAQAHDFPTQMASDNKFLQLNLPKGSKLNNIIIIKKKKLTESDLNVCNDPVGPSAFNLTKHILKVEQGYPTWRRETLQKQLATPTRGV